MQVVELKEVKDSSTHDILERLSSARSEANSLSEQLAVAKRSAEAEHKENLKLQKVAAHCAHLHACWQQLTTSQLDKLQIAVTCTADQLIMAMNQLRCRMQLSALCGISNGLGSRTLGDMGHLHRHSADVCIK